MKKLFNVLALTAISGLSVMPTLAFAQTADPKMLTCEEFNQMDEAGMMMAVSEMARVSNSVAMDDATLATATQTTRDRCVANPKVKAIEAMEMQ